MAVIIMVGVGSIPSFADNCTAYCVGVNYYDPSNNKYGDFRTSAYNAKCYYDGINNISASYSTTPTKTKLINHIDNNVIFLNSHAESNGITFIYDSGSGNQTVCGIKTGNSNANYVGLNDYSLSNVNLISFVGCDTALGTSNVTLASVLRGADSAVGFNAHINSRTSNGASWLNAYNGYLAQGYTVENAIAYANNNASLSDLDDAVQLYGYASTQIAPNSSKGSPNLLENLDIPVDFVYGDKTVLDEKSVQKIYSLLNKYISSEELKSYRITQNIFSKDNKSGTITFEYYINDSIQTNKAYTVYIKNGIAKELLYSLTDLKDNAKRTDEDSLLKKYYSFKIPESISDKLNVSAENIESVVSEYKYDYKTDIMMYCETIFYRDSLYGVIMSDSIEVVIK